MFLRKLLLGLCLLAAPAAAQTVAQWSYSTQNGTTTAAYPGNVLVLGSPTFTSPAGPSSAPSFAVAGNPTAVAGGAMATDFQWQNSSYGTLNVGGYWTQKTYSGYVFNKEFNASNTDASTGSPAVSLLALAYNNGSAKDVVAHMAVAIAHANNSSLFGFNAIATSTGNVSAIFRGGEIDIEPASSDTPLTGSAGLYFNVFSKPIPGAVIQSGGISGGSFANGFACGGVSGSCLVAASGASSASLVNASSGTYSSTAFVTGTGITQGFAWGTGGSGTSPVSYGDASNNLVVQLGSSGSLQVKNSAGTSTVFQVTSAGLQLTVYTVATLPTCNTAAKGTLAAVSDATSPTYNGSLTGSGAVSVPVYCNGSNWTVH